MKRFATFLIFCTIFIYTFSLSQNVVIVVIDGVRYSESIGAKGKYMPRLWNKLCKEGTTWVNFFNDGFTTTEPAHSTILTGTWQHDDNIGIDRPTLPTIFEYFRKNTSASESTCIVIAGKKKLNVTSYSTHTEYGKKYGAMVYIEPNNKEVVNRLKQVLKTHPRILIINLPDTDRGGHSGIWERYISKIQIADSLILEIWKTLQSIKFYQNNTTLFITNDHGRHDEQHGGFEDHGDRCEGCRRIMLIAIGDRFPKNKIVTIYRTLCDIAPTIGEIFSFPTPYTTGTSLLKDTSLTKSP